MSDVLTLAWQNFSTFIREVHLLIIQRRKNIFGRVLICNTGCEQVKVGYKSMSKMESYFCIFENELVYESKGCHHKHKSFLCSN